MGNRVHYLKNLVPSMSFNTLIMRVPKKFLSDKIRGIESSDHFYLFINYNLCFMFLSLHIAILEKRKGLCSKDMYLKQLPDKLTYVIMYYW